MRLEKHQTSAAMNKTIPFAGLGFDVDTVQIAAQMMTPRYSSRAVDTGVSMPVLDYVAQPSGYSLLVALGREIRGR